MKRLIKWFLIIVCGLIVIVLAVLLIAPRFIDIQKFKPQIERYVSDTTGRTFTIGNDIQLTLFPLASITANDICLENAPKFEEKYMVSVQSFDVSIKLMPFLRSRFKDVQVERFTLRGARIVLEKDKKGTTNWEELLSASKAKNSPKEGKKTPSEKESEQGLPITAFSVGEFNITDSSLDLIDHSKGDRLEVSNLNIQVHDFSMDRPILLSFSAQIDGHPLSLTGKVGPLGKDLGRGSLPMDLSLNAQEQLELKIKGSIKHIDSDPFFDLTLQTSSFSPRRVMAAAGLDFPITTSDPNVLTHMNLLAEIKGDPKDIQISKGVLKLDDSKLECSGKIKNSSQLGAGFDLKLDQMDMDRYLPPQTGKESDQKKAETQTGKMPSPKQKIDYSPLRRLVLDGAVKVGNLKIKNAQMKDLDLKLTAKDGVFTLKPSSMGLYQGTLAFDGSLNVQQDIPTGKVNLQTQMIQSNPLIKDVLGKDILEGPLNLDVALQMKGDDADKIKKGLNGKGTLLVKDGVVKGVDLVSMVRNTDGAYGFANMEKGEARTEFSEFQLPFTIHNGIVQIENSRLVSTLLRVQTTGKADLVKETLNLRIEPTFVTTRKKDADKMKRSEVMVPVLVTGNLFSPKFSPDLKGVAKEKLEEKVFKSKKFKKVFEKEELKPYEKEVKDLLEGILEVPFSGKGE